MKKMMMTLAAVAVMIVIGATTVQAQIVVIDPAVQAEAQKKADEQDIKEAQKHQKEAKKAEKEAKEREKAAKKKQKEIQKREKANLAAKKAASDAEKAQDDHHTEKPKVKITPTFPTHFHHLCRSALTNKISCF